MRPTVSLRATTKAPGPVEAKFRKEFANATAAPEIDASVLKAPGGKAVSAKVRRLADELAGLTLIETVELGEALKTTLGINSTELLFAGMAMPASGAPAAAPAPAAAAPAAAPPPPKEVSTHVDIRLKSFDAKSKIKVIKEVRGVTNLGLKEAKDLVEAAPSTLLTKVKREDAVKMVEKLKAETGAEFELV